MDQLTLIEEQIRQLREAGVSVTNDSADAMRALCDADDLKLFWIENTAGKRAYFLARNARYARHHALKAGHIQALDNGRCLIPNERFFRQHSGFGSAVQRAINDRKPGPIEWRGNHAVMGDKVYSPMTVVR